jgi:hypothetical protein
MAGMSASSRARTYPGRRREERERDERGRAEGDLDREAADQRGAEHVHEEQDAAGSEPVAQEAAGWHRRSTGDAVGGRVVPSAAAPPWPASTYHGNATA